MARTSNATKELGEKNRATMEKCPIFRLWVHKHLRNHERYDEYEKAYNYVHSSAETDDETTV